MKFYLKERCFPHRYHLIREKKILLLVITGCFTLGGFLQSSQIYKSPSAKKIIKELLQGFKYIDGGSFIMGKPWDFEDAALASIEAIDTLLLRANRTQLTSVSSFYMGEIEITNKEYRQFVKWVRDSIAHVMLGHTKEYRDGQQGVDWKQPLDWSEGGGIGCYVFARR